MMLMTAATVMVTLASLRTPMMVTAITYIHIHIYIYNIYIFTYIRAHWPSLRPSYGHEPMNYEVNTYMCIYIHMYVYVYVYVYKYMSAYVHIYIGIRIRIRICATHTEIYICIYPDIHIYNEREKERQTD